MKKKIFNNGSNLELAYQETKVKFGNEEFVTTRHLVLSVLDKNGDKYTPISEFFNLDDEKDVYGEIYDGGEQLSVFRAIDEWLPDVKTTDCLAMCNAIANFETKLVEDMSNNEFAEKLRETIVY